MHRHTTHTGVGAGGRVRARLLRGQTSTPLRLGGSPLEQLQGPGHAAKGGGGGGGGGARAAGGVSRHAASRLPPLCPHATLRAHPPQQASRFGRPGLRPPVCARTALVQARPPQAGSTALLRRNPRPPRSPPRAPKAADAGSEASAARPRGPGGAARPPAPQDIAQATRWVKRRASRGNPFCQHTLARMYDEGVGVHVDRGRAMRWFRKAAEQGAAMHEAEAEAVRVRREAAGGETRMLHSMFGRRA